MVEPSDEQSIAACMGLTPKQERAISQMLIQPTLVKAAAIVGVTPRTLRRWIYEDRAFQQRYNEARRELAESTVKFLTSAAPSCAHLLWAIARNEEAPFPSRVTAARSIIQFAMHGLTAAQLVERMESLERNMILMDRRTPPLSAGQSQ